MSLRSLVAILCFWMVAAQEVFDSRPCSRERQGTIYDYKATTLLGDKTIQFSKYKGKVVLVVNVATYCGLTHQYPDMNDLQEQFKDSLVILGFPCNHFGKQEPGGPQEIYNGIKYVRPGGGFEPNFQLFNKVDVNGENQDPLFAFLKNSCDLPTRTHFSRKEALFYSPLSKSDIRWNWEKFLIDQNGVPYMRFDPAAKPELIAPYIYDLINKKAEL